jgi:hypothetical protein
MANKKINDLLLASSIDATMQLETDVGGSIANKITAAQVDAYVFAGKTGGRTLEGGSGASENLILDSTHNATKGQVQIANGNLLHANTTNYEALVLNNNDIPNKKYVDDTIGGRINAVTDAYTPTLGQTVFTLSQTRDSNFLFILTLNGQVREETTDFTVSGTTLTWLDPSGLTLLTTDRLIARYYY